MKSKLIIYKLDNFKTDYQLISDKIKLYPDWVKLMERTWIIKTKKSSKTIRTELTAEIENRGKIFVIDVTGMPWSSYSLDKGATEWLKENL